MTSALLDCIEAAAVAGESTIEFRSTGDVMTVGDIWRDAARVAGALAARYEAGARLGLVLGASPGMVSALLGAWRAGFSAVSLPHFAEDRRQAITAAGCVAVIAPTRAHPPDAAVPHHDPQALIESGPALDHRPGASLVQFTSGTTGSPSGVQLTLDAIYANVRPTLDRIDSDPGFVACSWLPLSHDMGLIGMLLGTMCAMDPKVVGRGSLILFEPSQFIRRPGTWLDTCSTTGTTFTSCNASAIAPVTSWIERYGCPPLRPNLTCVVGAELIDPAALRAFDERIRGAGASDATVTPAYGCAEMALAVTMDSPATPWRSREVPLGELGAVGLPDAAQEFADVGAALRDVRVEVDASGEILVDGPSLMDGYVGGGAVERPHRTGDRGLMIDDRLYVLGRVDDFVPTGAGVLFAPAAEIELARRRLVRGNRVAITTDDGGGYAVVYEPRTGDPSADVIALASETYGIRPRRVVAIGRGRFPLTGSGKVKRAAVASLLAQMSDDTPSTTGTAAISQPKSSRTRSS